MADYSLTIGAIRAAHPCAPGWEKLLRNLGFADGNYESDFHLSLGDVALSNGAADALWCLRCLDWSDITLGRLVIGCVLMPSLRRVIKGKTDYLSGLQKWNIETAQGAAGAAAWAAEVAAAEWAARAAEREAQRRDIIIAFPPIITSKNGDQNARQPA